MSETFSTPPYKRDSKYVHHIGSLVVRVKINRYESFGNKKQDYEHYRWFEGGDCPLCDFHTDLDEDMWRHKFEDHLNEYHKDGCEKGERWEIIASRRPHGAVGEYHYMASIRDKDNRFYKQIL